MTYTTTDLTPRIGTQVHVDRETLIGGAIARELRDLLMARGVLLFRGLTLSAEDHVRFAATLGQVRLEHGNRITAITADAEKSPIFADYTKGTFWFHVDGTYTDTPGFASVLHARVVAPEGGGTEFANTYASYEDLPEEEKAFLDTLRVVHTMPAALFPAKRNCTPEEFAVWHSYPERSHPLVWRHKSGRKSLVLSTSGAWIEGMHFAESHDLLQRLMVHATQEKYTYRHKWQEGDLAIWDNTGCMHRAMPFEEGSKREFHRCTLNGEEPVTGVNG